MPPDHETVEKSPQKCPESVVGTPKMAAHGHRVGSDLPAQAAVRVGNASGSGTYSSAHAIHVSLARVASPLQRRITASTEEVGEAIEIKRVFEILISTMRTFIILAER